MKRGDYQGNYLNKHFLDLRPPDDIKKNNFTPSMLACLRHCKTFSTAKPVFINLSTYAKHWFYEGKFQTNLLGYFNKKSRPTPLNPKITAER